jgi:16S rRNA (cytosine967-C5)-methyltransferase
MLLAAREVRLSGEEDRDRVPDFGGEWRMEVPEIECSVFLNGLANADISSAIKADDCTSMSVRYSIPQFVVRDWMDRFGKDDAEQLCAAANGKPPVCIRVNTLKCSVAECREGLEREGIATEPTQLSAVGLKIPHRISIQGLTTFRQGWFEIQDEGSQLVSMLLEVSPGMTVVDACAGGGGKSLHLASMMGNSGQILAVDIDRRKLDNFVQRCRRAGVTIATVEVAGPPIAGIAADAVLVDAPCSGTGTLRRNPGMKLHLNESLSASCVQTQRCLLEKNAALIKPGGRMVYATCTLMRAENQVVVEDFLSRHPDFVVMNAESILKRQGIRWTGTSQYLELLPHQTGTDGFFAAVLERSDTSVNHHASGSSRS